MVFTFGLPTVTFRHQSLIGHLIIHGLVWASFLVIAGVDLALGRRLRDHGVYAATLGKDKRDNVTPDEILAALKRDNATFSKGLRTSRNYPTNRTSPRKGRFPSSETLP